MIAINSGKSYSQDFGKLWLLTCMDIIIVNTRRHFRRKKMPTFVASISNKYDCQYFWKLELPVFREIVIPNISGNYNCYDFGTYLFRNSGSYNWQHDWKHCCNFLNALAGIFYLVVRRPMLILKKYTFKKPFHADLCNTIDNVDGHTA